MKSNLLIPTLLCTLLSSFYLTSPQPLQTTITTPFDIDGDEVQAGIKYYITPAPQSKVNARGGGLSLASRDNFCPPFVVQENTQLSKGLPLRFLPLDVNQSVITLSSDVNIVFNAATICVQSTVWRISSGGGDTVVGRRRYYVRSGGMMGSNWFRMEKVEEKEIGYKFVFCPSVCSSCKEVCRDVGVFEENGKKWLALHDQPFVFMLKRA